MTQLEALIGLNLTCDIGSIRLKKLLDYFDKPADILKAPLEKLTAVAGIGANIAAGIGAIQEKDIEKEINLARKQNIEIVTIEEPGYPENLKYIPDPPIVLYIKGKILREDRISLAIVGSRRASLYGLSLAEKFSAELAERAFTIVSGMARGIDTYAHRGALKVGARTIAVMGSGFNHIYPPENKKLMREISDNGAVISEFPMDMKPLKQNFPRRNRIISGLSLGVLVTEAARNSGALITADFALEQGREVFALPGKIDSHGSVGTHNLIKQGAKLVSGIDDILEELNLNSILPKEFREERENSNLKIISKNMLSEEEENLYNLISHQAISWDEIVEKTRLGFSNMADIMLRLQLKKLIRQLPGKQFIRVN